MNLYLRVSQRLRRTPQIILLSFQRGWSTVLTLLFLYKLKWLQIMSCVCSVSPPGSINDYIVSLDMLSKQTRVYFRFDTREHIYH